MTEPAPLPPCNSPHSSPEKDAPLRPDNEGSPVSSPEKAGVLRLLEEGVKFTQADFLRGILPPGVRRVELIQGFVQFKEMPKDLHSKVTSCFLAWLAQYEVISKRKYSPRAETDLPLASGDVAAPDAVLAGPDTSFPNGYVKHPALVVEVAVTSQKRDCDAKKAMYEGEGIPEYIIFLCDEHQKPEKILYYVLRDGGYQEVECVDGCFRSPNYPGLVLNTVAALNADWFGMGQDPRAWGGELEELKEIPVDKSNVSKLSAAKLASVIAAYLVDYEIGKAEVFGTMKEALSEYCRDSLTSGAVLANAKKGDAEEIRLEMIAALFENGDDIYSPPVKRSVNIALNLFMEECIKE